VIVLRGTTDRSRNNVNQEQRARTSRARSVFAHRLHHADVCASANTRILPMDSSARSQEESGYSLTLIHRREMRFRVLKTVRATI
jgi:hypothetical protein